MTTSGRTERSSRRVDARAATRRLVIAFGLDRGRKAPTLVKPSGPLKALERERLRKRLDELLCVVRDDGERVGVTALVSQARDEARWEVPTRGGDLPSLVVGAPSKVSPVLAAAAERAKQRWLAKHPEARAPIAGGRPRKRGVHDTLLRIVEVVESRATTQPMRDVVLLLFVLGAERDVFGEPRDGDDATTYLARAAKALRKIVDESNYERAGRNDRRALRR